jgi:hypothetical protein
MEREGSLPHSQELATRLYPEPDQSSPYAPSHFLKIYVHITLPSTPRLHVPNLMSLSIAETVPKYQSKPEEIVNFS